MLICNYNLDQYTTYNCPNVYSTENKDQEYEKALQIFESLFEKAHQNKKKKEVELKVKM